MTDNEIIKALEYCCGNKEGECEEVCYQSGLPESREEGLRWCRQWLIKDALDLINRQKAEIEKLKQNNDILSRNADTAFQDGLNESKELYKNEVETEIKSKTIKEFAERLKNNIDNGELYNDSEDYCLTVNHINSLLEGMTEGKENA